MCPRGLVRHHTPLPSAPFISLVSDFRAARPAISKHGPPQTASSERAKEDPYAPVPRESGPRVVVVRLAVSPPQPF